MTEEEMTEEELRKAWEARLAKTRESKVVYINSDTGRNMPNPSVVVTAYEDFGKATVTAGTNENAGW